MQAKTESKSKIITSIRIDPEVKERITELAQRDRRTFSAYMEKLAVEHLATLEKAIG